MPDSVTSILPPEFVELARKSRPDLFLESGELNTAAVSQFIEGLPKNLKEDIYAKIEEKKRRMVEERSRYYVPMPIQEQFHRSTKKIRLIAGGNQSGKTEASIQEMNWWATGTHPLRSTPKPPVKLRICSPSWRDGIGKTIIPKIKEVVKRSDLKGGSWETGFNGSLTSIEGAMTVQYANGSFAELMTYEQDVAKFGGTQRDLIIHDEEPPQQIYQENLARTAQTNGEIVIAMTPVKGSSWVSSELIDTENPDVDVFFLPTMDNIHLPQLSRDALFRQFSQDPDLAAARLDGQFVSFGGLVFKGWREDINGWRSHIISDCVLPAAGIRVIAIDPAPAKSHAALWGCIDPSRIHINRYPEISFYKELLLDRGMSIEEFANAIRDANRGEYIEHMIIDPHWDWDNNAAGGMNIYREFKRYFPQLRPALANKDDIYYESLKSRMVFDDLNHRVGVHFFAQGCQKAAKQMKNLAYKEVDTSRGQLSDTPKVRRVKNDLVDCAGMIASDWIAQHGGNRKFEQPNYIRDPFTGRIIG